MELKNKKVLQMGLGILGGGVATARFLIEQGANLTVTDMKSEEFLKPSLDKLPDLSIVFKLGGHDEKDFLDADMIVINPDVPADNIFVNKAREAGKPIENELTLFYAYAPCKTIIGVTGTRGKTTTTNWIAHILQSAGHNAHIIGNDPNRPFLSVIKECTPDTIAVVETPSFQLEIFGESGFAPHIAVITNLYQDHLSRHHTMEEYARAKANIFKNQTEEDVLVLNKENEWTKVFLGLKPKGHVLFSSDAVIESFDSEKFGANYGAHNLQNFFVATSVARACGVSDEKIVDASTTLPSIKWRQELVYEKEGLKIYNDTAATSPEASSVAIDRYISAPRFIVIAGGTDRELDFREWGKQVNKKLTEKNLILLSGSATEKMKKELSFSPAEFDSLEECFKEALSRVQGESVILFSPGAKSFEKFKNEFDRGEKFNVLVKEIAERGSR